MFMPMQMKLVAAALAVAVITAGGAYLYTKGRSEGKALAEAEYNKEVIRLKNELLEWQTKVATLQDQHADEVASITAEYMAKEQSLETQIDKLKKQKRTVTKYVPVETDCKIPNGFVEVHNLTAQGKSIDEDKDPQPGISDKTLTQVADTVAENYYSCNLTKERLIALQKVVADFQQKQKELTK